MTASRGGSVRVWQAATNGAVAQVTPLNARKVLEAMLAADGRLVIVSADGVRLYSCEPCLPPARLKALANERLASKGRLDLIWPPATTGQPTSRKRPVSTS